MKGIVGDRGAAGRRRLVVVASVLAWVVVSFSCSPPGEYDPAVWEGFQIIEPGMDVDQVHQLLWEKMDRVDGPDFPIGDRVMPRALKDKKSLIAYWLFRRNGLDNPYMIAFDGDDRVVGKVAAFVGPPWEGRSAIPGYP
jgi:hypothetical protein